MIETSPRRLWQSDFSAWQGRSEFVLLWLTRGTAEPEFWRKVCAETMVLTERAYVVFEGRRGLAESEPPSNAILSSRAGPSKPLQRRSQIWTEPSRLEVTRTLELSGLNLLHGRNMTSHGVDCFLCRHVKNLGSLVT